MTTDKPKCANKLILSLSMLLFMSSGQCTVFGQTDSWRKDAGAVANRHVGRLIDSGNGVRASLVGYQRGLGVPLVAIYNYEGYTGGGFLKRTMLSVAMQRDQQGDWHVVNVEEGGVFDGLPLRNDWRQVAEDGARVREIRRRGY